MALIIISIGLPSQLILGQSHAGGGQFRFPKSRDISEEKLPFLDMTLPKAEDTAHEPFVVVQVGP